jgi:putative hydrolase of the HAD superfamily
MIKNLIFDFGGVIAPISREQAVEAFRQLGVADADQRLDKYHQTGIFQELEEGKITPDEFQEKLGQLCGGRTPSWEETRQARGQKLTPRRHTPRRRAQTQPDPPARHAG